MKLVAYHSLHTIGSSEDVDQGYGVLQLTALIILTTVRSYRLGKVQRRFGIDLPWTPRLNSDLVLHKVLASNE